MGGGEKPIRNGEIYQLTITVASTSLGLSGGARERSVSQNKKEGIEKGLLGRSFFFFFFVLFVFLLLLGPLPPHMEVPRLGVQSEL